MIGESTERFGMLTTFVVVGGEGWWARGASEGLPCLADNVVYKPLPTQIRDAPP